MQRIISGCLFFTIFIICFTFCQDSTPKMLTETIGPITEIVSKSNYSKILHISTIGSDLEGDGSKEQPWQTIPFALSQIQDAGVLNRYAVYVAEGNYTGQTIVMKSFVDLYGGFSRRDWQRNLYKNPTILSGAGKRRVLIGFDNARLDGFVISKGAVRGKGGGLFCDSTSPVITNNIFMQNQTLSPIPWEPKLRHETANDGGAIYGKDGSSPTIENNLFFGNKTEVGRGAAIALHRRCAGRIANNVFLYNKAGLTDPKRSSDGGAISVFEWSSPVIENNVILENKALTMNDGGGIFSAYWSSPVLKGNIIVGNSCGDDGGGVFTAGQNHHDEYPPMFDPIPDEKEFFIKITDNVFIGNNEALEFTMESRGLFANNIVAHNGDKETHPAGVYFQRSEAHVINNTILDPFLMNYKTFDAKKSSQGLGPSTLKNNRIWGSFDLKTDAIVANNFMMVDSENYPEKPPDVSNDWLEFKADADFYGKRMVKQIFTTHLVVIDGRFTPNQLVNRVIKAGDTWGVIKSNNAKTIEVWGDLTGEISFSILPTYRLR